MFLRGGTLSVILSMVAVLECGTILGNAPLYSWTRTVPRGFVVSPAEILEQYTCFAEVRTYERMSSGGIEEEFASADVGPSLSRSILRTPNNTISGLPLGALINLSVNCNFCNCSSSINSSSVDLMSGMCGAVDVSPQKIVFVTENTYEGDCEVSPFLGTFLLSRVTEAAPCDPSKKNQINAPNLRDIKPTMGMRRFVACVMLSVVFCGSTLCLVLLNNTSKYIRSKLEVSDSTSKLCVKLPM